MNENIHPKRLLAIGDIHGCLTQLQKLLGMVLPDEQDQVVFLGDYVDRGPDSAGVIEELIDFRKKLPRTVFLRGNHEQMLLDYLAGRNTSLFLMNGGDKTLASYRAKGWWPLPEAHLAFLKMLKDRHETNRFIFVHAGLRPGAPLTEQVQEDLLWIRQDFICSDYDWGKTVVYGHTPLQEPFFSETRVGLDTGCVYGRVLTCCDLLQGRIWQA
jgi:serine/threonine protein phosphatase 1